MSRKSQLFEEIPLPKVKRNYFDLSHEVKMSGKFGLLYPVLNVDCLPGDEFNDQMTVFMRFAPMLAPIMHRVDVTTHFFFVPYRLLTDFWEDLITGGQDGTEVPVLPYLTPAAMYSEMSNDDSVFRKGSLWDYLGLPVLENAPVLFSTQHISALPFRAYAKIWNDWYRDPNLDVELEIATNVQGNVSNTSGESAFWILRNRMWEKDFLTSALPFAQRGAEVLLPLAGTGSVTYRNPAVVTGGAGGPTAGNLQTGSGGLFFLQDSTGEAQTLDNIQSVELDTSTVTMNDFRFALAVQKWMENAARGGGRYVDAIRAHFNVQVPDFRLQRAEYLGGGKQPVTISQVLSTADSGGVPVGDMAGHGVSVGKTNRFSYRVVEHGIIMGIMSVVPRTAYSQGLERMWTRETKFDFAFPELAHLGEQQILSKEAFFDFDATGDAANNGVFGYIPRYAEYKFRNDRIAGDFRDTLDFWHLGRLFTSRPVLDPQFTTMYENNTADEQTYRRIFAVTDGTDYLWCQLFHKMGASRPLPYFGVPQLIG